MPVQMPKKEKYLLDMPEWAAPESNEVFPQNTQFESKSGAGVCCTPPSHSLTVLVLAL
jgi:hypothetical protein